MLVGALMIYIVRTMVGALKAPRRQQCLIAKWLGLGPGNVFFFCSLSVLIKVPYFF